MLTNNELPMRKVSKYGVFPVPYFPTFELNKERYSVSLSVQFEYGPEKTLWTLFTQCPLKIGFTTFADSDTFNFY